MGQIEKGVILSIGSTLDINGNSTTACVQSMSAQGTSTLPLTIPWYLRGEMGNLSKGTEVVYVVFADESGVILTRMDGNWDGEMDDISKLVVGNVTVQSLEYSGD